MTFPRLLPDADALIQGLLADALPTVRVSTQWENDFHKHLPYVWIEVSNGPEKHPQFGGLVVVSVQCFAAGSYKAVRDLAEGVRVSLYEAHRSQTVRPEGHLSSYRLIGGPSQLPSDLSGVYRSQATYQLGTRPNAAP